MTNKKRAELYQQIAELTHNEEIRELVLQRIEELEQLLETKQ